ncbi:MAG: lipopolysaccharide biosynthesis protein [Candidatus Eisenbacteria bacterium]
MNLSQLLTRVVRHSAVYGLADFVGKAIGFLLIPLYTRKLSQEAFGQLQILLLFQTFGVMTFGIGQIGTVLRYHPKARDDSERSQLIRGATSIVALSCTFFLVVGLLAAETLSVRFLGGPELTNVVRLFLAGIIARVVSDLPLTLLRIEERSARYGAGTLLRLLMSLVLILYFVVVRDMGVLGVVLGDVIASAVLFLSLLPVFRRHWGAGGGQNPDFGFRAFLSFGWPYMVVNLGAFGLIAIDRLFLAGRGDLVDAGVYSLGGKLASLVNILVLSPFTLVWGPLSFRLAEEDDPAEAQRIFSRLFTYFAFVLYVLGLALYLFAPEAFALAAPPEYADADRVVPLLVGSMIVFGFYKHFQVGLAITGKTKSIATSFVLAALCNLAANAALVPRFGMMGAAVATLLSYFVMCGFLLAQVQRVYPVPYEWRRVVPWALVAILLGWTREFLPDVGTAGNVVLKAAVLLVLPVAIFLSLPANERQAARKWVTQLW